MTTVLDDYTARSSQELSVTKGQHVRIVQKSLPNAPDWCLIRTLNEQQALPNSLKNHSGPSSLAAFSTTISGSAAAIDSLASKYTEGLVPAAILKATKTSSSNVHLPPPLSLPQAGGKNELGKRSASFSTN